MTANRKRTALFDDFFPCQQDCTKCTRIEEAIGIITAFCTTLVMGWICSVLLCIVDLLRNTTRYGLSLNLPCFSPTAARFRNGLQSFVDVLCGIMQQFSYPWSLQKDVSGGVSLAEAQIPRLPHVSLQIHVLSIIKAFFIP